MSAPVESRPNLSDKEMRTLKLVAKGKTNLEIGKLFWLTESTIGNRISRMMFKLNARNRTHLVSIAYQMGYLEVDGAGPE